MGFIRVEGGMTELKQGTEAVRSPNPLYVIFYLEKLL